MPANKKPKTKFSNRKRLLSRTPITLSISKHEKDFIKRVPHKALTAFKENIATATCWYTLSFRTKVGLEIAKAIYTDEVVEQMELSMRAVEAVRHRYHESGDAVWSATPKEIEAIELGLEDTDLMQDQTTRRDQLTAHHAADKYMRENT